MNSDKKAMIQTVVLSVFLPILFYIEIACLLGMGLFAAFPISVAMSAAYYFVVLYGRKSDVTEDSYKKRRLCSLLIQAGMSWGLFLFPLVYAVFFVPLESKGHLDGIVTVYMFFALIEPLAVHIGGLLFYVFMVIVSDG